MQSEAATDTTGDSTVKSTGGGKNEAVSVGGGVVGGASASLVKRSMLIRFPDVAPFWAAMRMEQSRRLSFYAVALSEAPRVRKDSSKTCLRENPDGLPTGFHAE